MENKIKKRMKQEDRHAQLLDVALEMFIERGYQGTAMEDIAQLAGVSRPLVYKIFGSKDALYLACLKMARAALDQAIISHASQGSNLRDRLQGGLNGYFEFAALRRKEWNFLYGSGVAVAGAAAQASAQMRFETVQRIAMLLQPLAGAMPAHQLDCIAHALSGAGEQVAKYWLQNTHLPRQSVVGDLVELLWGGLGAHAAPLPQGTAPN